jgi:hypothetical protein
MARFNHTAEFSASNFLQQATLKATLLLALGAHLLETNGKTRRQMEQCVVGKVGGHGTLEK